MSEPERREKGAIDFRRSFKDVPGKLGPNINFSVIVIVSIIHRLVADTSTLTDQFDIGLLILHAH